MSLDFPNREDWLAYRTNFVRPLRYIHVSGYGLKARRGMVSKFEIPAGVTYDRRRNELKRVRK